MFRCILNNRLNRLLDRHGIKAQFGASPKVGCQDGRFTLKTLLNLRHQHNLSSFVAFVDLVKAFDTMNHVLLVEILQQYGAPFKICSVVDRMYHDLTVLVKLGKEEAEIPQIIGVRQGNSLSPVLFIFLMSALAESLKAK